MPNIYIVAGPNGVGKTTFSREFLPRYAICKNFINADLIAAGLAPFSPESVAIHAGRLVLEEIERLASQQIDFGLETTLSGRSYMGLIRRLKNRGYKIHIYFLWVPTDAITLSRVKERVLKGGHDVPEVDVRRRFGRSIENFLNHYRPLADSWILFDNSKIPPSEVAFAKEGELRIIDVDIYRLLMMNYGY
ncbi:MAG TPA: zeta toxin family protein [Candidatus Angelobacter sp.]